MPKSECPRCGFPGDGRCAKCGVWHSTKARRTPKVRKLAIRPLPKVTLPSQTKPEFTFKSLMASVAMIDDELPQNFAGDEAIMTEDEKLERYGPVVAEVASSRDPSKKYQVRCSMLCGVPVYFCQCPGWAYRKSCKHVDACKRNGVTSPKAKEDPLVEAIEGAFSANGVELVGYFGIGWWMSKRAKVADYIRNTLDLAEPVEEVPPTERPIRVITLRE